MLNRIAPALLFALLMLAPTAGAQPYSGEDAGQLARDAATVYSVDLSRTASQLITIRVELPNIDADETVLQMPVWRPGRYEILDPAGTVRTLSATDAAGNPVAFTKTDKSTWRFETAGVDQLIVEYTIYANSIGNRTRHADATHAFMNPSCVFMYDPARRAQPVRVSIHSAPQGWKLSTGMEHDPTSEAEMAVVARDYDTLVDCPIEVGIHDLKTFDVRGVPHEIMIWGRHEADFDKLTEDFAKIVESQARVFEFDGPLPYGRYVFMIHCGPGLGGGTEHINSTIMLTRPASFTDDDAYEGFLGLVSHEMFHTWNVKRMRPAGITPYEYQHENYTDLLWVAEGTTSYYDDLVLVRTGLIDVDTYLGRLQASIGYVRNNPGLSVQTLEESSFDAWIKFNKRTPDSPNTTVNFYSQGAMASLIIDHWIRDHTADERSLDNAMRLVYEQHTLESGGFTTADLAAAIAEASEQPLEAATELLEQLAGGTLDLPLEAPLLSAGLELTIDDDQDGSDLGLRLGDQDGFALVRTVYEGRPAFGAGVIADDVIIAIDGIKATQDSVGDLLERTDPGTRLKLTIMRRSEIVEITLTTTDPQPKWELEQIDEPTRAQRARFQSWTGQPFDSE